MTASMRCPVCGGTQLTPPTTLATGHGALDLQYQRNPQGGLFSKGTEFYRASLGSACLACGHLVLFVSAEALERLRRDAASLHPVTQ